MRKILIICALLLVALLLYAISKPLISDSSYLLVKIETPEKNIFVSAQLATTPAEWEQGLMFRSSLDNGTGMLFVFPDEQPRTFWMKNTLIPLDIIFISANYTIVNIKENFVPCQRDPCETYTSTAAKYALEVNANFSAKNNVTTGTTIRIWGSR